LSLSPPIDFCLSVGRTRPWHCGHLFLVAFGAEKIFDTSASLLLDSTGLVVQGNGSTPTLVELTRLPTQLASSTLCSRHQPFSSSKLLANKRTPRPTRRPAPRSSLPPQHTKRSVAPSKWSGASLLPALDQMARVRSGMSLQTSNSDVPVLRSHRSFSQSTARRVDLALRAFNQQSALQTSRWHLCQNAV
jgi:hypothetical protein